MEDNRNSRSPRGEVVVTGATGAIGREITKALLRKGERVVCACRNKDKAGSFISGLCREMPDARVRFVHLDLGDEKSVRSFAESIDGSLEGLICNAGVMMRSYVLNASGKEQTMTVNFYNTLLLATLLIPKIREGGALVFTTSLTRFMGKRKDFSLGVTAESFSQLGTYGLSKKALTAAATELSRKYGADRLRVNCADPGIVDSDMITMQRWYDSLADIFFRPFIRKPSGGAVPALRAFYASGTGKIYCRRAIHSL